jgi:hypothetical protein
MAATAAIMPDSVFFIANLLLIGMVARFFYPRMLRVVELAP